jgi:hypothetical protein
VRTHLAWSVCGRRFARREDQRSRTADSLTVLAQRQATGVAPPRRELQRDRSHREALIRTQSAWSVCGRGGTPLRELLRIPFNLWLLERLFERGTAFAEVSPIQSEVQLLNLFWRQRVRTGPLEPDQRLLASRAAEAMVRRRTLWAQTNDVYEAGANEAWRGLHSSEVLQDANETGTRVSFGHNVLFDYAVSVEVLDDDAAAFASFLRDEPDRALFLRPTLDYFLARLWFTNRPLFWRSSGRSSLLKSRRCGWSPRCSHQGSSRARREHPATPSRFSQVSRTTLLIRSTQFFASFRRSERTRSSTTGSGRRSRRASRAARRGSTRGI